MVRLGSLQGHWNRPADYRLQKQKSCLTPSEVLEGLQPDTPTSLSSEQDHGFGMVDAPEGENREVPSAFVGLCPPVIY